MTILLVDDNKANLFTLEKLLEKSGYSDCISFTSAKALLDYLYPLKTPQEVDLILLDIMMPEIDGIEACKRIRTLKQFNATQIIFVTALENKERLAEALDVGGNDYISKPLDKIELLARIRVALKLKKELDWHTTYDQKIQSDLTLAAKVQQNLLSAPLHHTNLRITASYQPSAKLAGDMYYWHRIDEHRYAILLIDMMGHGVSAALVCMYISSILRESVKTIIDPTLVMHELNRHMVSLPSTKDDIPFYFTGIYLIVNTQKKTIDYVNAGQPSCYITQDGKPATLLSPNTVAIGFFEEISINKSSLSYETSLQIVLTTDGVLEAMNTDEFTAEKKLQQLTSKVWPFSTRILDEVVPLEEQLKQADDMCVILIQTV